MKKVFTTLTSCLIAGSFVSAYADQPIESVAVKKSVKHHKVHHKTHKTVVMKDQVAKDQAPAKKDDGLWWMDNLTGNLTWVSNYIFRGISQTRNLPAIQGGLTYTFPIGIYANMWGSNVKFAGTGASIEIDGIVGYHKQISDFIMDLSVARYFYPGAHILNYNEFLSIFNYKFLQFSYNYSADVFNVHQSGTYIQGGINYDIPSKYLFNMEGVNITALTGHYSLPAAAGNTYNDYLVSVAKKLRNYTFSLIYTTTDGRQHASPLGGTTYTAQLAANF